MSEIFRRCGTDRTVFLTASEEIRLSELARSGDEDARQKMILANMPIVIHMAKRYLGRGLPFEDIISEGTLGLIRAVQKFDPSRGCRFPTHAKHWIKNSIIVAIVDNAPMIRVPRYLYMGIGKACRANRESLAASEKPVDRFVSSQSIDPSSVPGCVPSYIASALRAQSMSHSYDSPDPIGEYARQSLAYEPKSELDKSESEEELWECIQRLEQPYRDVLLARSRIRGHTFESEEHLAKRLHCSRKRVHNIHQKAHVLLAAIIRRHAPNLVGREAS